jgi:hypothetical protein
MIKKTTEILDVGAKILAASVVLACLVVSSARADDVMTPTLADYEAWMAKYADAKPDFKPGDVLTVKDLERMRPFIPPGYFPQLNFPELKMEVIAPVSHMPRRDYMDCTEKYQNQVKLSHDGLLQNYVCGQPFSNASLSTGDPSSGLKGIWNYEYKWINYGLAIQSGFAVWDSFNGSHDGVRINTEIAPGAWTSGVMWPAVETGDISGTARGGGNFTRVLQWFHQRVYFNNLAQVPSHTLDVPGAKDFMYKEFTGFFEPFDIRGTAFIIYRYQDTTRSDDAWAYIPNLRRVRRISAEVKSDSLLGTDATLEDFYGFSGREPDWNFKFLGWKDVLCVLDPKDDYSHSYGPNGMVPDDVWSMRKMAVILRTPKDPRHPFSGVINFFDAEAWNSSYHFNIDRKGKLWKIIQWQWKYSDTFKRWAAINHGVQAMTWQHGFCLDVQQGHGTLWFCGFNCGFPNSAPSHVAELYDINKLEQIHR